MCRYFSNVAAANNIALEKLAVAASKGRCQVLGCLLVISSGGSRKQAEWVYIAQNSQCKATCFTCIVQARGDFRFAAIMCSCPLLQCRAAYLRGLYTAA